ncbi:AAA family ATPase [Deinococcus ficus]|nr:AAA family ATPase [Deinococcus ficus]
MKIFDGAFQREEKFFETRHFSRNQTIRPQAFSAAGNVAARKYSPTIALGAVKILIGEVSIYHDGDRVYVTYQSSTGGQESAGSVPGSGGRLWSASDSSNPTLRAALVFAEALLLGIAPETRSALSAVANLSGYPVSSSALKALPEQNDDFITEMHRVVDAAYFENKGRALTMSTTPVISGVAGLTLVTPERIAQILGIQPGLSPAPTSKSSVLNRLARLTRRGGAALLIGPPGVFKTETIKQLVLQTGHAVVKMRGSPGIEDQDFLGMYTPGADSKATWVDGPLARAFRLASRGPTILHIDEILRFLPETLNVLVTAMDELSYDDAVAVIQPLIAKQDPEKQAGIIKAHLPNPDARYYMLQLPQGTLLFAPKPHLSWLMTTNMGEDHLQVAANIDAALLSRIHLVIDMPRAEPKVTLSLYERILAGVPGAERIAKVAQEFENNVYSHYQSGDGNLARPLDPRKVIAMLQETRACLEDGMPPADALVEAALVTAVPHCAARNPDGSLEEVGVSTTIDFLKEVIRFNQTLGGL